MRVERDDDEAPPGFRVLYPDEPFEVHAGPHYFRDETGPDGTERRVAGMRARPVHTSASGLYQPAVIGTHFTGIILPEGKARFAR